MTPEVIGKLEEAFLLGCSDLEACLLADISKDALYDYQQKNPDFTERKERLKETPILKARKSVIAGFDDSPELALKYLERKRKDEFGTKQEINLGGQNGENPLVTKFEIIHVKPNADTNT